MLSAGQLSQLRSIHQATAMPDTGYVFRYTLTDDLQGGKIASYTQGDSFPCRLMFYSGGSPGSSDAVRAGRIDAPQLFLLTFPVGTFIAEEDQVRVNDVMYEIVSALDARTFETAKRLLVKRV